MLEPTLPLRRPKINPRLPHQPGLWRILLAATALSCAALAHAARPVEAFVAPAALFGSPDGRSTSPSGLPAYERPGGRTVGQVRQEPDGCDAGPEQSTCVWPPTYKLWLVGGGGSTAVETGEWSYEQLGLITYARPRLQGGVAWTAIAAGDHTVWIRSLPDEVHEYERLATLVEAPPLLCAQPGKGCTAPTPAELKEMARLAPLVSCYPSPYTITDVVARAGRRYYRLEIDNLDGRHTSLRQPVYVPTRTPGNQHTGTFYARGC